MTSEVIPGTPEGGFLGRLRSAALIAVLGGAAGSVGVMFRAGRHSPQRFLLVLIAIWVLAPYMFLVSATVISKRWSTLTRSTLYSVMLVVALGSLSIYINDALRPRKAQPAAVFVGVPLASWLLMATVVPIAAFISGRRSRQR